MDTHSIKHNDVKLANILLEEIAVEEHSHDGEGDTSLETQTTQQHLKARSVSPSVRPIIADFGISKDLSIRSRNVIFRGNFEYLAPEQIDHIASGLKADVFSMGCCLLMLFAAASEGGNGVNKEL